MFSLFKSLSDVVRDRDLLAFILFIARSHRCSPLFKSSADIVCVGDLVVVPFVSCLYVVTGAPSDAVCVVRTSLPTFVN